MHKTIVRACSLPQFVNNSLFMSVFGDIEAIKIEYYCATYYIFGDSLVSHLTCEGWAKGICIAIDYNELKLLENDSILDMFISLPATVAHY